MSDIFLKRGMMEAMLASGAPSKNSYDDAFAIFKKASEFALPYLSTAGRIKKDLDLSVLKNAMKDFKEKIKPKSDSK